MARFFISVLEGDSPATATPVVATGDPQIVAEVARVIAERLGVEQMPAQVLKLAKPRNGGER